MFLKLAFDIPGRSELIVVIDGDGAVYLLAESVGAFLNRRSIYNFKNRYCKKFISIPSYVILRSTSSKTTLAVFTFQEMINLMKVCSRPLKEINEIESFWMHGYVDNILSSTVAVSKKFAQRLVVYRCLENISNPILLQNWISNFATACKETFLKWDQRDKRKCRFGTRNSVYYSPMEQDVPMDTQNVPMENVFAEQSSTQQITDPQSVFAEQSSTQRITDPQNVFAEQSSTQQITDPQNDESRNIYRDAFENQTPDFQIVWEMFVPRNFLMNINGILYRYQRE